jgi:hypothetical protein
MASRGSDLLLGWAMSKVALETAEVWGIPIDGFAISPFGLPTLPILPLGLEDGSNRIPKGTKIQLAGHPVFWLPASVRQRRNEPMAKYNLRLNLELFYRGYLNMKTFAVANIFEDAFGENIANSERFALRINRYIDGARDDFELNSLVTREGGLSSKQGKRKLESELEALYTMLDISWKDFCDDYDSVEKARIDAAIDRAKSISAKEIVAPLVQFLASLDNSSQSLDNYRQKIIGYLNLIDKFIEDAMLLERSTNKEDYIDDLEYFQLFYEADRIRAFGLIDNQASMWFEYGNREGLEKIPETIALLLQKYQVQSLSALGEGIRAINSYDRWTRQLEDRKWMKSQLEAVSI